MLSKDKSLVAGPMGGYGVNRLENIFDELYAHLDQLWRSPNYSSLMFEDLQPGKVAFPKLDVTETEDDYTVDVAVAGFSKEDVEVELKDNTFFIKGSHQNEESADGKKYLRKEISKRSFRRVVRFPEKVDVNAVECSYKDGIVTCKIDKLKKEPSNSPIKVVIN